MMKRLLLMGCLSATLVGVAGAAPEPRASAAPRVAHVEDPWQGLRATPAPILIFGGKSYFPIQVRDDAFQRRWEFIGDGEDYAKANRMIVVKVEPVKNLRAYEKGMLGKMGVARREVHYRSANHLIHSWTSVRNSTREFRFMDWSLRDDGLLCCEVIIKDCFFLGNHVSAQWRHELEAILATATSILPARL